MDASLVAALRWSALNVLTKERYEAILQVFGSLEQGIAHLGEELLRSLGCREETAREILMRFEAFDVDRYAARLEKGGVRFMSIADSDYPKRLREIGDPPVFLYAKGDLSILEEPILAIVGTRKMSRLGRQLAGRFVPEFVRAGLVTVSGLALGIDAQVAEETLGAGGRTIAVLGHGMATVYPKSNTELAKQILAQNGLILSEFPLDLPPDKYTFPSRNRVIAGLSLGTLVLEAPEGSGSVITAELALEYGREVFAVPGSPLDEGFGGCNALIAKSGAKLVRSPEDVLQELGIHAPENVERSTYAPKNETEEVILRALSTLPQKMDAVLEKSRLDPAIASSTLTMLELAGAVKNCGEGMWVRM